MAEKLIVIGFGKYTGHTLEWLLEHNVPYLCWLTGSAVSTVRKPRVYNTLDEFVAERWRKRTLDCGCDGYRDMTQGSQHETTCRNFILAGSEEETRDRVEKVIVSREWEAAPQFLLEWIDMATAHQDVVAAAIAVMHHRCWHCGGFLVAIGSARVNGAAHSDWDDRRFHKKCYRVLLLCAM